MHYRKCQKYHNVQSFDRSGMLIIAGGFRGKKKRLFSQMSLPLFFLGNCCHFFRNVAWYLEILCEMLSYFLKCYCISSHFFWFSEILLSYIKYCCFFWNIVIFWNIAWFLELLCEILSYSRNIIGFGKYFFGFLEWSYIRYCCISWNTLSKDCFVSFDFV